MMKLNRNAALGILLVIALVASLGFLATRHTRADKPGAMQAEVTPTAQQQQPIKDLMLEKKTLILQKESEISGAIKMLMAQLTDPITGKVGLESDKWTPISDGKDGFKFVQPSQSPTTTAAPPAVSKP